ncbi:helix-turn-helix domain-containing protein [Actinocrispum wychmicini]|uniref:Helix-turn-helix protein n=1 Tax=Actinocrispum wychmicini TaxID=1213861 RepID=A0A4R2J7G5_9PSEU|nr:helix-turn-helix transcriptional regulator [Actinocrispum wychmicini]TCO55041.1 helix-turn-helix protein [Actinocrispum wychmicini]
MGHTPEPNYFGRKLIREVRALRTRAGLTQAEAGERAHIPLKKLSRLETIQLPSYHELCAILDIYGVLSSDWQPYLDLWEHARKPPWWRPYQLKDPRYLRMEDEAATKSEFQLGYVPELLQTEEYARQVFAHTGKQRSEEAIDTEVEIRMRRQQRLFADPPLTLHALVHETALHQGIPRSQLTQLAERAELPNVTLQIVPNGQTVHEGLRGSLVVLSFPDADDPDVAFTDTTLGLVAVEDPEQVADARRIIEMVAALALSPRQSLVWICRVLARLSRAEE